MQNLSIRLGEHNIRTRGETDIFESPAARVVRHVGFSSDTLVCKAACLSFSVSHMLLIQKKLEVRYWNFEMRQILKIDTWD